MTVYRSKIGAELVIPLTVILGGIFRLFLVENILAGMLIISIIILFIGHMFYTTRYFIEKNSLRIVCGFFFDKTIDINQIASIKETNNAVSSPAVSLDRLEIRYHGLETVIVSPKNKSAFIQHLQRINPNIEAGVPIIT